MKFQQTGLAGALLVGIEPHSDRRGFFARTWCAREFAAAGLPAQIAQTNLSRNTYRGTVRGLHLQLPPSREGKLVSCQAGAIYDVIVDLRPTSPTFMQHYAIDLTAQSHDALYIPPGCAHGFQTLADATDVLYQMTDYFEPELAYGVRWNDPAFGIRWPLAAATTILPRDAAYPDFDPDAFRARIAACGPAAGKRSGA